MTEEAYRAVIEKATSAMKAYVDSVEALRPEVIAAREDVPRKDRDRIEREVGLVEQARRLAEAL
jgi:hypothetical protein